MKLFWSLKRSYEDPKLKITSRTRGQTEVYRGPLCPNGHEGIRYQSTDQCVECERISGRKGSKARGSLPDAVRRQSRWVESFERNFAGVSKIGIETVLKENHGKPLYKWLYRMRTHWDTHLADRQERLLSLGQPGWWLRTDPPLHQTRSGFLVWSPEHRVHKKNVVKNLVS